MGLLGFRVPLMGLLRFRVQGRWLMSPHSHRHVHPQLPCVREDHGAEEMSSSVCVDLLRY